MQFLEIGSMWINTHYITSIHRLGHDWGPEPPETIEIHFGEDEASGCMTLRDEAEIAAILQWLTEQVPTPMVVWPTEGNHNG